LLRVLQDDARIDAEVRGNECEHERPEPDAAGPTDPHATPIFDIRAFSTAA
jgi:hypothetical protein